MTTAAGARTVMGAAVSLDGFIATDDDGIGPLFECYGNGDVSWSYPGEPAEFRTNAPATGSSTSRRVRSAARHFGWA